jgi:hypothetical protein
MSYRFFFTEILNLFKVGDGCHAIPIKRGTVTGLPYDKKIDVFTSVQART